MFIILQEKYEKNVHYVTRKKYEKNYVEKDYKRKYDKKMYIRLQQKI